ncbi:hypothetical protein CIPAW_15G071200 [Carya illinoinensis]|uniref:Uncharacterized protein n=1 Tax=Carya illinoinensis TaxID=32201 RepID=A0A8T1NA46_CARIL|nr:hypothetical protein CIPAW_15G071200 [Carya illinoinensis]
MHVIPILMISKYKLEKDLPWSKQFNIWAKEKVKWFETIQRIIEFLELHVLYSDYVSKQIDILHLTIHARFKFVCAPQRHQYVSKIIDFTSIRNSGPKKRGIERK